MYASTSLVSERGFDLLKKAINALLASVDILPAPTTLWSMQYRQHASSGAEVLPAGDERVIRFPPSSMDLSFDDTVLQNVQGVWQTIMGSDNGEFLVFQDREIYDDDE